LGNRRPDRDRPFHHPGHAHWAVGHPTTGPRTCAHAGSTQSANLACRRFQPQRNQRTGRKWHRRYRTAELAGPSRQPTCTHRCTSIGHLPKPSDSNTTTHCERSYSLFILTVCPKLSFWRWLYLAGHLLHSSLPAVKRLWSSNVSQPACRCNQLHLSHRLSTSARS